MDHGLAADTTYLYKVRAIGGAGPSEFTPIDPATTIIFSDSILMAGPVRAVHILELRTAVNAMRTAAEVGAISFTGNVASGTPIQRIHIVDLRQALDEARDAIGVLPITYSDDPTITAGSTRIKAAHVDVLRAGTQ
jgi:hypothetical protein